MERRNYKKLFLILFIFLIAAIFAMGIAFTILKNERLDKANIYDGYSDQIKDYEDNLS